MYNHPGQLAELKNRQIATLKQFSGVIEEQPRTVFSVPLALSTSLRLYLDQSFPTTPPNIFVQPLVSHPWVDSNGKVTSPSLQKWVPNTSLIQILNEVLPELQQAAAQQKPKESFNIATPDVPSTFPCLDGLRFDSFSYVFIGNHLVHHK